MGRLEELEKRLDDRLAALDRRLDERLAAVGKGTPPQPPAPAAPAGTAGGTPKGLCRRLGLSVGLDHVDNAVYHGAAAPLRGCVTDATDFHRILEGAGFESRLLTDAEATRESVVGGIRDAARLLEPGDLFVMAISSHGARDALPGDPAPHEFWCLWDGLLPDMEIVDAFNGFAPGARIVVVTDQCHSGGVFLPPGSSEKAAGLPFARSGGRLRALGLTGAAGRFRSGGAAPMLIQFAACRGRQTSLDSDIGGRWITALIKCLAVSHDMGWREWFDRASAHDTIEEIGEEHTPQWVELGPVTEAFRQGRIFV